MFAYRHTAPSAARIRLALSVLVLVSLVTSVSCQSSDPPPRSDTITAISQFLVCSGNPYALCYYSGPETAPDSSLLPVPALPCTLAEGGKAATCTCFAIEDGTTTNYVALPSILNPEVRLETEATCGPDGKRCLNMANQRDCADDPDAERCQAAPVCRYLGDVATGTGQTLYPKGALISTFSFQNALRYPISSTPCDSLRYAGCMTANCTESYTEKGQQLTKCLCPTYVGDFQFGQQGDDLECNLGGSNVWSAANMTVTLRPPDSTDVPD